MELDDEYLHPFARMFESFCDVETSVGGAEEGIALRLDEARLDLPIELDVGVTDEGTVALAGAPPTQHVETTYMPVFHRISLSIRADEDLDGDG